MINKRRVDKSVVYRAMTIVAMAFFGNRITSGVIMVTTPPEVSAIDAVYEAVSAFGTVGLTTGLTPDLSIVAKNSRYAHYVYRQSRPYFSSARFDYEA